MARLGFARARLWLLEVEMGAVWAVAGLSIILFMFASIWFIDPALLTLVLQFREARCRTEASAVLVGISNCSWTSCRLGCTRDVYKCWQVQVHYDFVEGSGWQFNRIENNGPKIDPKGIFDKDISLNFL